MTARKSKSPSNVVQLILDANKSRAPRIPSPKVKHTPTPPSKFEDEMRARMFMLEQRVFGLEQREIEKEGLYQIKTERLLHLTVSEAVAYAKARGVGCTPQAVRNWANKNPELNFGGAHKKGDDYRVHRKQFYAFLEARLRG